MRVVFLDFDGVLNRHDDWIADGHPTFWNEAGTWHSPGLKPELVARLNALMERSGGAKVVVSSSWRLAVCLEDLRGILRAAGFTGEVIGETPANLGPGSQRGHEIQRWLDEHLECTQAVILDDADDMAHLRDLLVQTDPLVGLTDADVGDALVVLGAKGTP